MLKHLNSIKYWQWAALSLLFIALLYFAIPPKAPLAHSEYSTVIYAKEGELLHAFINADEQWHFPPHEVAVPQRLKTAVITFEDENFYRHLGIDIRAIVRAAHANFKNKRVVSGASTIPMQIARLHQPKKRTYLNKLREALYAIRISIHFRKETLLSIYLNHAPYGGNVIGYRTASLKFFGKEPDQLTWSEAATLAVLPNAPGLIYPTSVTHSLEQKRNALLDRLMEKDIITERSCQLAKLEPIPDRFLTFISHAPHLARNLKQKHPHTSSIETTIHFNIQKHCNRIAQQYQQRYAPMGINNLSLLVANTQTGEVLAYVGSPDFFDSQHGGQVDGVRAARSSGSVLKPFLYALSMDEGLITPQSMIRDLPTYFDGFSPKNASNEYEGLATARDALIRSLNIPAVRLLNAYGVFQFYLFLKEAGVQTLHRSADDYGLPLILGGAEVNLWDMVALFRGLGNEGVFSDNVLTPYEQSSSTSQLISSGASYLTLEMIRDLKRPGSEYYWERFASAQPFAWKTGTSYGHKDAWAVGVNPQFTIGVWVGNFNGEGNKNLGGATSAGPILFDILRALQPQVSKEWFQKNEMDFQPMAVCALSGFRAGEACPEIDTIEVPYGMKPLAQCDYHEHRYFSSDGRYQTCSRCWDVVGAQKKVVTIYPPDVAHYLRLRGKYIEPLPSHYPKCLGLKADATLRIIYPNLDAKLFLPRDFNGKIQPVVCNVGYSGVGSRLFWYLDDVYLGETTGEHKMGVIFKTGWNTLKVIDEFGASDTQRVQAVSGNSQKSGLNKSERMTLQEF